METTQQLAGRLKEVVLNGTWIANTNYKQQLENLHWKIAITQVSSLNTIADLAQHIHYYLDGIKNVVAGESLDIKEWNSFLSRFFNDAEELASLVENMPEEKLDKIFVHEKFRTYRRNIEGMIEHSYYHLGQIERKFKASSKNMSKYVRHVQDPISLLEFLYCTCFYNLKDIRSSENKQFI